MAGPPLTRLFYGWVIVGVVILVTCVGFGAMLSLSVFLQPMAEAMGWSRTGIATAARPVFALYQAPQNLRIEHPDCGHLFSAEMREEAYKVFDETLK